MKVFFAVITGLVLAMQFGCAKSSTPQDACGFVQNSEGQRVSWKSSTPIPMYFDASFPTQYMAAVQDAIATWEKGIGRHVFDLRGSLPPSQPAQDGLSVIYWLTTWDPSLPQQQANTTIYWVDNQVVEADIRVNAKNFTYSSNPGYFDVDIESLVLHELGHTLGLKHDDAVPSVMATSLPSGYLRRSLYASDLASVKCEY
jgi:hypothetical protein